MNSSDEELYFLRPDPKGLSKTYQNGSALLNKLKKYAEQLSEFEGTSFAGFDTTGKIKSKALVIVFEEGAADRSQAKILSEFMEIAKKEFPGVKVNYKFIE